MIKIKPRETIDFNEAFDFLTGDKFQYKTTIVRDELQDNLLLMPWHMPEVGEVSFCSCGDFSFRQKVCKHLQEGLDLLKSQGVQFRLDEKPVKPKEVSLE
jgi:hypothetical protein